ncbi:MAG: hypothetical protein HRT86_17780 [Ilumatobacteraceae bacterium]|nr:hypothetical protein [Ilumatobacteraceae bacterium]
MGHRTRVSAAVAAVAVAIVSSCGEEATADPTAAEYLADLEQICVATAAELDALPDPPELISVTDFADAAASELRGEADQARTLDPPRIDDLDDDHRAFVRNTEEQAATWAQIATVTADDPNADLGALTTQLGELLLGRDDLVTEMGAPQCRRTATGGPGDASPSTTVTIPGTTGSES